MADNMKIETDIPMPGNRRVRSSYPLRQLEVGNSFAVQELDGPRVRYAMCQFSVRNAGWKFTTRTLVEDGETVVRCWRIA